MSNQYVSPWPDGAVALLRKWHSEGLSMNRISIELAKSGHRGDSNYRYSRNAIIGKCHRLGLPSRGSASNDGGKRKKPRVQRRAAPKPRKSRAGQYKPAPPKLKPRDVPPPEALMISIMELNDHNCHWPIGNPGEQAFGFCGALAFGNLPYCEFHSRLAYVPVTSRAEREAKREAERVAA